MASRTYLPKLKTILLYTCKYMKRWEIAIRAGLPEGAAQTAFTACLAACQTLEEYVAAQIPPPT